MGIRLIALTSLAALELSATGCLRKDTTQTIYLDKDGTVTWTVLEKDVSSDESTAAKRAAEEAEFAADLRAEHHPAAMALGRLDPMTVRTDILRAERPYTVFTQARFSRFDWLMGRFAAQFGMVVMSTLERQGDTVQWAMTVYPAREGLEGESAASRKEREGDGVLEDCFEHCRFVLAAGHFTDGVGFDLSKDGRIATFHPEETTDDTSAAKPLNFSLTWTEIEPS